uniref:GLPGLI family protein n=3 Tax=Flavobacterium sp. TaxID=239 RepID=UPI004048EDDF
MINKPFILLPFIIQPNFSKRGIIDYKVLPKKIKQTTPNQALQNFIKSFNEHQFHFRLTFDHALSFFDATDKADHSISNDDLTFAHTLLNFCPQFLDAKKKTVVAFKNNHYEKKTLNHSAWRFLNQSKMIGSYKVFKAELDEVYITSKNEKKTRLVVAWYCPDLPYSFGPLGYFDLPGLILELDKSGHKFIAEQIHINPKEFDSIQLPE